MDLWTYLDQWVSNNPIATIPFSQQTPAYSSDIEQAACWRGAQGVERAETAVDPLTADPVPVAYDTDWQDPSVVQRCPAHHLLRPSELEVEHLLHLPLQEHDHEDGRGMNPHVQLVPHLSPKARYPVLEKSLHQHPWTHQTRTTR